MMIIFTKPRSKPMTLMTRTNCRRQSQTSSLQVRTWTTLASCSAWLKSLSQQPPLLRLSGHHPWVLLLPMETPPLW